MMSAVRGFPLLQCSKVDVQCVIQPALRDADIPEDI